MRERRRKFLTWAMAILGLWAMGAALGGCVLLGLVAPGIPTEVQASDGTYLDHIVVAWPAVPGASRYEIYRAEAEEGTYAKLNDVSGITYSDAEVTVGTIYWYKVKACNRAGCSDFSAPDSGFASSEGAPGAPSGVTATDGTYSDRVRVTWNASPGATNYEVYRRAGSATGTYALIGATPETTFDDTGVAVGTTYWYKVRACGNGCSELSDADSGYAAASGGGGGDDGGGGGGGGGGGNLLPGQPQNVQASDGDYADKIVVRWTSVSGAARYEVWRADAETGDFELVGEPASNSFTDTTPALCELWWYKVRAWNSHGFGYWSFTDSGYTGGKLGKVDASKIKVKIVPPFDGLDYTVYLEWPNVKDADKYDVVYEVWRRGPTGFSAKIDEAERPADLDDPATYTDDSALTEGKTYYYKIRACSDQYADLVKPGGGSCGDCGSCIVCGDFSTEVPVVVSCNPSAPELKSVTYAAGAATLQWTNPYEGTAAEEEVAFEVWRARARASDPVVYSKVATVTGDTGWTDGTPLAGLPPAGTPSGKYTYTIYYKVKSCFECGCGVFSNVKSFQVTITVP